MSPGFVQLCKHWYN